MKIIKRKFGITEVTSIAQVNINVPLMIIELVTTVSTTELYFYTFNQIICKSRSIKEFGTKNYARKFFDYPLIGFSKA